MLGINEIIMAVLSKKKLSEEEKFKILHSKRVNRSVIEYLMSRFADLSIEIFGNTVGSLFELMSSERLMGWCWQTTESAIVFLNDDDYIERGYLNFDEDVEKYYHSWICFNHNGIEYVLDPCLNFLCKKKDYDKIFEPDVKGIVSAKAVKEELIRQITSCKEDNSAGHICFESFMYGFLGSSYNQIKKKKDGEVIVSAPDDVCTPLYRNGSGYKTEIAEGKIRKLIVHYYDTEY